MAFYPKKEWCELCGVTVGNLHNYINRGKTIMTADGMFDDSEPKNALFLKTRLELLSGKSNEVKEDKAEKAKEPKKSTTKAEPKAKESGDGDSYSLERRLKKQELLKKEAETRLLNLKEEKLKGEHMPTEMVKSIVVQLSQSFITAFKDSMEDFITIVGKSKGMNVNEIAEYRGKLSKMINQASVKSVDIAKKSINNIVNEYAVKREVGEHD
jgi:hypothetical protein